MQKITAISVKVGCKPKIVEIDPTLENLQDFVGGYIECFNPWSDGSIMILNENGKYECDFNRFLVLHTPTKKPKAMYITDAIYGDFLIVNENPNLYDEDQDFLSLTEEQIKKRMADLSAHARSVFYHH